MCNEVEGIGLKVLCRGGSEGLNGGIIGASGSSAGVGRDGDGRNRAGGEWG